MVWRCLIDRFGFYVIRLKRYFCKVGVMVVFFGVELFFVLVRELIGGFLKDIWVCFG